jgi:hypothetical protein
MSDQPDLEMIQQRDDILYHLNDETERIIEAFESLLVNHSDSDELNYDYQEDDTSDVFYHFPPLPPGSDIDENNTDTEDGGEELIDLMKANMKLLAFLSRQQTTIARLRARIIRLSAHIRNRIIQPGVTIEEETKASSTSGYNHALSGGNSNDTHASSDGDSSNNHASSVGDSNDNHASSVGNSSNDHHASSVINTRGGYYDNRNSEKTTKRMKTNALVLMDSDPDMTLATMSSPFNPKIHLDLLLNKRIQRELKKKQASSSVPSR